MIEMSGPKPPGVLRAAPLGVPVVPDVRMIVRPPLAGGASEGAAGAASSLGRPVALADHREGVGQVLHRRVELVVVDDPDDLLLIHDLCQAAGRQAGVEEDEVDADRRGAGHDLDGADVVAGQESQPLTGLETLAAQQCRRLLAARQQVRVRHRTLVLVDDGDLVGAAVGRLAQARRRGRSPTS